MTSLESFFSALRGAAEDAGLALDSIWRYQEGSPLAYRQSVLQQGLEPTSAALGFCLAATMFGTSRAKAGSVPTAKSTKFTDEVKGVLKSAARIYKRMEANPAVVLVRDLNVQHSST